MRQNATLVFQNSITFMSKLVRNLMSQEEEYDCARSEAIAGLIPSLDESSRDRRVKALVSENDGLTS